MEDLDDKVLGNQLTAAEFVQPMEEIQTLILNEGIGLSSGDSTQLAKALSILVTGGDFYTATGTMPTKVLTKIGSHQNLHALVNGVRVRFRSSDANVTTVTLNVDGLGAKSLLRENGDNLQPNDVISTVDAIARYDTGSGGRWLLTNPQNALYPEGHVRGFAFKNDTTDADHDIEIGPGECADSTGTFNLVITAAKIRGIDVDWTFAGGGGMPTALTPPAIDTWFGVFIIGGGDAVTTWGYDTSPTATGLLALASSDTGNTYDKYRLLYDVLTGNPANLTKFYQSPTDLDHIHLVSPVVLGSGTVPTTLATVPTIAPPGSIAEIFYRLRAQDGSATTYYGLISPTAVADIAPSSTVYNISVDRTLADGNIWFGVRMSIDVDSSSEFQHRFNATDANVTFRVSSVGWRYNRGRV